MGSSTTNQAVASLVPKLGEARRNEARLFALQIVRDPRYRAKLMSQAQAGLLSSAVETMLWHYAFGKPVETVEVGRIGESNYEDLSREALINRAIELAERLRSAPRSTDEVEGAAITDVSYTAIVSPSIPAAPPVVAAQPVVSSKPLETAASRAQRLSSTRKLVVDEVAAHRVLRSLGVEPEETEE